MSKYRITSVPLTPRLIDQAAAVAEATGTRRASVLRHACAVGLAELARQLSLPAPPVATVVAIATPPQDGGEGE